MNGNPDESAWEKRINAIEQKLERELEYIYKKLSEAEDLFNVLLVDVTRLENRLVDQDRKIERSIGVKQVKKKKRRRRRR